MRVSAPPHVARLLQRIETLDAPAVQLWAWPGSGQQAVLDALVAAGREVAQPLSLDDLGDPDRLRQVVGVAADAGARWLVLPAVPAPPRAAASALATLLPAGKRLLFSAWERRSADPVVTAWVDPRDHLLTEAEVAALWSTATGREPAGALVESLLVATDGWYRPLALLAERAAAGRGIAEGELTRLLGVQSFLRHEVLGLLTGEELSLLDRLALSERIDGDEWHQRLGAEESMLLERLDDSLGLLLPAEGEAPQRGDRRPTRLPALLRRHLLEEAEGTDRSSAPSWRDELRCDLAEAERRRGEPAAALALLAASRGGGRLTGEILEQSWPELLTALPAERLSAALAAEADRPDQPPPLTLLRAAVASTPDVAALAALAAEPEGEDGDAVRAVASCALVLHGRPPGAGAGPGGSSFTAAVPAALEPLQRLAAAVEQLPAVTEGSGAAEADPADEEDHDEAAATRLASALVGIVPPEPEHRLDLLGGGLAGGSVDGETVATRWAAAAVERVRREAPAVGQALVASSELPAGWRRWLTRPRRSAGRALRQRERGYTVTLLGEGRVERRDGTGERRELSWPLKRAFKALAFLATQPGLAADRTSLERALWPREDADAAESLAGGWPTGEEAASEVERNFHPTLSHLRRGLLAGMGRRPKGRSARSGDWPPPLLHAGGIYRLNPALDWEVDASELVWLLSEGQKAMDQERVEVAVEILERARSLYAAPLLAGYEDSWIVDRRERYQRIHLELLRSLGETYIRLGRLGEAMDSLRTVLIADPLQERVHRALMHIYGRQGRRDLVRRQYDRLADVMMRELSVEPQEETTELYHRLMA